MRDIQKEIQEKLREIEEKEHVRILHAVESGSRSWGVASPDSDYDVRFIYVREPDDYLRLDEVRDVIEWQLDEVLDINGWDLKKVLIQFHRSNASLFEWANSPIVYKTTDEWKQIYEAAKGYFSVKATAYHYYGTANSTYMNYLQDEDVKYKKYFYALRPLLAARYIEQYQCPPPIRFDELMDAMKAGLPEELRREIEWLQEIKKVTEEKDKNPQNVVIREFIGDEIRRQKELIAGLEDDRMEEWDKLNEIFRKSVENIVKKRMV